MTTSRRISTPTLVTVVSLLGLWLAFGPIGLAGSVSLAVTGGNSMEPMFHSGDLVIVRETESIRPEDIILYRSVATGQDILHRVIGTASDGGYLTQGDNNAWVDPDHPGSAEIRGRYWFHLPDVGRWIAAGQSPGGAAAVSGILMGLIAMTMSSDPTGRPGPRSRQPGPTAGALPRGLRDYAGRFVESPAADLAVGLAGTLILAGVLLAAWGFSVPSHESLISGVPYSHTGNWDYAAPASNVPAVQTSTGGYVIIETNPLLGAASAGQPVFLSASPTMFGQFDYRLNAQLIENIRGVARVDVVIRDDTTGWNRTFELAPAMAFEGPDVSVPWAADMAQVRNLFLGLQQATGTTSGVYRILAIADVDVNGSVDGYEFTDEFQSHLSFRLELPRLIRLESASSTPDDLALVRGVESGTDMLHQVSVRSVPVPVDAERVVVVQRWTFSITALRAMAIGMVVAAALALAAVYGLGRWTDNRSAWELLQARYRDVLVSAASAPEDPSGRNPTRVHTFQDLMLVAEARFQPITLVGDEHRFSCYVTDLPNGIFVFHPPADASQSDGVHLGGGRRGRCCWSPRCSRSRRSHPRPPRRTPCRHPAPG